MDMDDARLLPRAFDPRRPLRRAAVRRASGPPASTAGRSARRARRSRENVTLLPHRRGGPGGGLPALPALPAGNLARPRRLARHLQHRLPRARPDRGRRAGRGGRRGPGRPAGRRRAAAAAAVPPAPRRLADRRGPDPAGAAGQAADPRDPAADGRGGAGVGLRQRAPLQRDVPAAVRPPAGALRRIRDADEARQPARCRCVCPTARPTTGTRSWRSWRRAPSPASRWSADDIYARTIAIGDDHGVISVAPADRDRISVTVRFPDMAALPAIIARVRRVFDLAADPDAIGAHLSLDPALAPLVAARPGLRVPGAWDGFELAVRAILGQQITVPAATNCRQAGAAHGEPLAAAMNDAERPDPCVSRPRGLPAPILRLSACRRAGRGADVAGRGGGRRSGDLQPGREPGGGDRGAAGAAGHRRMDGAIHRHARAARARRLPRRRHRPDARDG